MKKKPRDDTLLTQEHQQKIETLWLINKRRINEPVFHVSPSRSFHTSLTHIFGHWRCRGALKIYKNSVMMHRC